MEFDSLAAISLLSSSITSIAWFIPHRFNDLAPYFIYISLEADLTPLLDFSLCFSSLCSFFLICHQKNKILIMIARWLVECVNHVTMWIWKDYV